MVNEFLLWLLAALLYFLVGVLVTLCYIFGYRPGKAENSTWLGLLVLFWWFFLLLDVVLQLASGLGRSARWTAGIVGNAATKKAD